MGSFRGMRFLHKKEKIQQIKNNSTQVYRKLFDHSQDSRIEEIVSSRIISLNG